MTQVARFRCSDQSFKQLWQLEIKPDEKDASMLNQWRELRRKVNQSISLSEEQSQIQPTTYNHPKNAVNKVNLLEKIRILAMSLQKEDYFTTINTLVSTDYANSESRVINHFQPRFNVWFNQQQADLETFIKEAKALDQQTQISELLTSLRHFYQSNLPEEMTLPVYLIAHPQEKASTSGLVFAENSIIEVLKGEKAKNRLGVVIHEIAHFYHERAPKTLHDLMMNQFVTKNSSTGKVGYYLFNEAIATAIGNGLLEERIKDPAYFKRYLDYPMSFYANEGIDTAAKSALELVKEIIDNGQSIDQQFLSKLDQVWGKSLKHLKHKPKERFRHIGMIFLHESADEFVNEIFTVIAPSSAHLNTLEDINKNDELIIDQFTHLDTIIVTATWHQLNELKLEGLTNKDGVTDHVQIIQLPNDTVRVVIVSQSTDFIKTQIKAILNQGTF